MDVYQNIKRVLMVQKASVINTFIDAICMYKFCAVLNDNMLKGPPMLLDGFSAEWYQGVKATLEKLRNESFLF